MKTVVWVQQALDGQQEVIDYILERFGAKAAFEFQEKVERAEEIISKSPRLMPVEPVDITSDYVYRSIIIGKLSKMLYIERTNDIIIVDFWDVRQDPNRHIKMTK